MARPEGRLFLRNDAIIVIRGRNQVRGWILVKSAARQRRAMCV
jgi:hypothetical protein